MHYVFTCNNGEVTYLGTAGSRHGHFQIPAGGAYPGLFWQNGNMGYYPGYYYYLENGRLQKEYVLLEEEIPYEVKVTQETKDDALFQACKNASERLDEYNLPAIRKMGWDAFVSIYAAEDTPVVSVTVNGVPVQWTDAAPFIDDNNRTMVPLRAVGDALGLTVRWDGNAREAIFTNGIKTIYFPIDSTTARTSDGRRIQMDTAAVIVSDRTYAPVRYLAEYFGFSVSWDGATKTVIISGKSNNASEDNTGKTDNSRLRETYTTFLRVLRDNKDLMFATNSWIEPSIAFCDVGGDELPEMIYAYPADNSSVKKQNYVISMCTSKGTVLENFVPYESRDFWLELPGLFACYQLSGSKDLYCTTTVGDASNQLDMMFHFSLDGDTIHTTRISRDNIDGYFPSVTCYRYEQGKNDPISEETYLQMRSAMLENVSLILLADYSGADGTVLDGHADLLIPKNTPNISMSYDDAIAFLEEQLK